MQSEKNQRKAAKLLIERNSENAECLLEYAKKAEERGDSIQAEMLKKAASKASRKPIETGVTIYGSVVRKTEKAILFDATFGDWIGEAWFPTSTCEAIPNQMNGLSSMSAPAWMVKEKLQRNEKV